MPSISSLLQTLVVLGAATAIDALPARFSRRQAAGGLTDIDILQFALTLEHLESAFYAQGFAQFPASDFQALGLSDADIQGIQTIGETEATHVTALTAAISGAGAPPVQPCTYKFGFTTAADMVETARILEAVGVSAYLGAAPLVQNPDILSTAGTIVTVEARHQTFIRTVSQAAPIPAAFDTPLGPRAVFTLASQFIESCPDGSNLNIPAFPAIALNDPAVVSGQSLVLQDINQPTGAQFCAFVSQSQTQYTPLEAGACTVPGDLAGEVFMMLTSSQSVADEAVLAGPSVIVSS